MITEFDDQLEDLQTKIYQIDVIQDSKNKGLLISKCYLQLNELLQNVKIDKNLHYSKQSKVLQQKSLLDKVHTRFLKEVDIQLLTQDALKLELLMRDKKQNTEKISLLTKQIHLNSERIDFESLSSKEIKVFNDVQLITQKANLEEITPQSIQTLDLDTKIRSLLESEDKLNEIVEENSYLRRQSLEIVRECKALNKIDTKEDSQNRLDIINTENDDCLLNHSFEQEQERVEIHAQKLTQRRSILQKIFYPLLEIFRPLIQSVRGILNFVRESIYYRRVQVESEEEIERKTEIEK